MMENEKLNILYVDDEEQNLISFKAAFRRYHNIFTANSGREGMEILLSEPIHLIITDQRMPEMTGIQFLEKVILNVPRHHPDDPDGVQRRGGNHQRSIQAAYSAISPSPGTRMNCA